MWTDPDPLTQSTVRCFWPVRAGTRVFYSFFDQSVSPRHCMVIVLLFYQMFLRMMMKKPNSSPIITAFITFLIRYSRFLLGILRHQFQTRQQKCLLVNCILVLTLFHCRNAFRVLRSSVTEPVHFWPAPGIFFTGTSSVSGSYKKVGFQPLTFF